MAILGLPTLKEMLAAIGIRSPSADNSGANDWEYYNGSNSRIYPKGAFYEDPFDSHIQAYNVVNPASNQSTINKPTTRIDISPIKQSKTPWLLIGGAVILGVVILKKVK